MKIYTKGGDKGSTSLLGGRRVPKHHQKIEAYGTIDELMAFVGLLMDSYDNQYYKNFLLEIQDHLMRISSLLAADSREVHDQLPKIYITDVEKLEKEIDRMEESLPPLRSFLLPGGNYVVSLCHVARTITRRAERITIRLAEEFEVDELIITYLNRLSDLFFVLGRLISKDLQAKEFVWNPQL